MPGKRRIASCAARFKVDVPEVFLKSQEDGWGFDGSSKESLDNLTPFGVKLINALIQVRGVRYIRVYGSILDGPSGRWLHEFDIHLDPYKGKRQPRAFSRVREILRSAT